MSGIENNHEDSQYQLFEAGEKAGFVQYRMSGTQLWVLHSSFSHCYKSATLVAALLSHVLQDARRSRLGIAPFCPALRAYMGLHPEYNGLVPDSWRYRWPVLDTPGTMENTKVPMDYVRFTGSRRAHPHSREPVAL